MIPLRRLQRREANNHIDDAHRSILKANSVRNLDSQARDALNRARGALSLAETIIVNQPSLTPEAEEALAELDKLAEEAKSPIKYLG